MEKLDLLKQLSFGTQVAEDEVASLQESLCADGAVEPDRSGRNRHRLRGERGWKERALSTSEQEQG